MSLIKQSPNTASDRLISAPPSSARAARRCEYARNPIAATSGARKASAAGGQLGNQVRLTAGRAQRDGFAREVGVGITEQDRDADRRVRKRGPQRPAANACVGLAEPNDANSERNRADERVEQPRLRRVDGRGLVAARPARGQPDHPERHHAEPEVRGITRPQPVEPQVEDRHAERERGETPREACQHVRGHPETNRPAHGVS
jgi:hypothetical protein